MRRHGTKTNGEPFTDEEIRAVWRRGAPVPLTHSDQFRKDSCHAWIHFGKYGETLAGGCGWEIDHILPVSQGGTDALENLQPLQWQNNRSKGDDWPSWHCAIPDQAGLQAFSPRARNTE
jgi:5-methylcytosine-specific restriction endonuclease McrA